MKIHKLTWGIGPIIACEASYYDDDHNKDWKKVTCKRCLSKKPPTPSGRGRGKGRK